MPDLWAEGIFFSISIYSFLKAKHCKRIITYLTKDIEDQSLCPHTFLIMELEDTSAALDYLVSSSSSNQHVAGWLLNRKLCVRRRAGLQSILLRASGYSSSYILKFLTHFIPYKERTNHKPLGLAALRIRSDLEVMRQIPKTLAAQGRVKLKDSKPMET